MANRHEKELELEPEQDSVHYPALLEEETQLEAEDPSMIQTIEHLRTWMLQDEQAVLQMILAIKESYEEAQAEAAKGKNTTSRLLSLTEQQEGVVNYLQKEVEKLRLTLIEERRPDVATTSFSTISQKEKRPMKLPDPPVFFDGKEPNIDHWLAKMRSKLLANEDHMPTEILRKAYVENRVNGDAMRHIEARLRKGAAKPFETAEEMLELLERIYGDPNRKLSNI